MTLSLDSCSYSYRYRQKPILNDFSYEIQKGTTILLGPNGAGKSTLLGLAASVMMPRSGSVTFRGISSKSHKFRSEVALMPQNITPLPSLTSREYVAYIGWLKGMSRGDAWSRSGKALDRVHLGKQANSKTSRLSGGQLRRVGVASALVHSAQVLLLDEPTAGMDPQQRRVFRDIIQDLAADTTVLLSTHDVADLAEDADQVTVLDGGCIRYDGATKDFFAHTPPGTASGRAAEGAYISILGTSVGTPA